MTGCIYILSRGFFDLICCFILIYLLNVALYCLQRDEVIQKDVQERQRLEEELKEQQGLINALTTETATLREGVAALQVREYIFLIHHCWYDYSLGCPIWEHAGLQRPHTASKCCYLFSVSFLGQVATTDSWDGAEVGRHGNGDGRTWSAGNPRWHTPGAQSQSCRSALCVCVKQ